MQGVVAWYAESRNMWMRKFSNAARGIKIAVRGEISFFGHLFATTVVVLAGAVLDISQTSWCLLTLCIALVLVAEMFNTAIERPKSRDYRGAQPADP